MESLPFEIKLTYIISIGVILLCIGFIVFVVLMYNRKQLLHLREKQLTEAEYQNQMLQKELEKQKSIEQERIRISNDMHDDLGAGISAIKLQAEFIKQKITDESLRQDIAELLKTSEEMNLSMRELLWSLNSGNNSLGSFVDYSTTYATGFLKKSAIELLLKTDICNDVSFSAEWRRNMFLCLKEVLNNAYKHSKATVVKLAFRQDHENFIMEIEDNGIGFVKGKSEGNGMQSMRRRMANCLGEFHLDTVPGKTTIIFKVKY